MLFLSVAALPQDTVRVRNLEIELINATGKRRLEILNDLAWEIKYIDLNRATVLSTEALSLAESLNNHKGIMLANKNLGICYFLKTDLPTAEKYVDVALEMADNSDDLYQKGKIYNLKAITSRDLGNTSTALKYQTRALAIFREISDSVEISGNLHNLAILYERINEEEKALDLYYEVFEIESRLGNNYGIARTSNNLAGILAELDLNDKAIEYYNIAVRKFESVGNLMGKAASLHGLGLVYKNLCKYEQAIQYFNQALEINIENGYNDYIANNYLQLGQTYSLKKDYLNALNSYNKAKEVYFKINQLVNYGITLYEISDVYRMLGDYRLCLEYVQNALNIAKLNGSLEVLKSAYYRLYELSRRQGNLNDAIQYLESYNEVQDSIKTQDRVSLMLEIQAKYEFELVEKENARLLADSKLFEQKLTAQKIMLTGVIVIAIMLFLMVVIILANRKRIKHKNKLLEEANATRDKFFSIIAHDLKNPFSGLLGFSELMVRNVEVKDRQTLKVYATTLYKAINVAYQLVENLFDWSRAQRNAIQVVREDLSLRELTIYPISLLTETANEKKISLINHIPNDLIIHSDRNLLTTILRNLLSNAIKFTEDNGKVEVNARLKDQGVLISVKDNGTGIESGNIHKIFSRQNGFYSKGTRSEPGTGLGLILCQEFVERLDGKIWVESELGKGSTFSFFLPEKG
jgi:signal transduction histidine kinase